MYNEQGDFSPELKNERVSSHFPYRKPKFIFIMGSTASGKSDFAFELACKYQGVIVNCDSLQVYKGLAVSTSLPPVCQFERIPHLLFEYLDYPQRMTAGEYVRQFWSQINLNIQHKLFIVVGGTGFYFQALEKGMLDVGEIPIEVKNEVDHLLEKKGFSFLYQKIIELDSSLQQKISSQDHYRIRRAYEIMISEGKSISQLHDQFIKKDKVFDYPLLKVGVRWSKEELLKRVQFRTQSMIEQGLIQEIQRQLDLNHDDWAPLKAVGLRETCAYLNGQIFPHTLEKLKDEIVLHTMQLAKKQKTWFQRDPQIHWLNSFENKTQVVDKIESFLTK